MNSARLVFLIVVIFAVGVAGIYWIYQSQVGNRSEDLLPVPTPIAEIQVSPSPQPTPSIAPSIAERNGQIPNSQPESGFSSQDLSFPQLP